jgi:hypothetical protein
MPYEIQDLVGLKAIERIPAGQELRWAQFGSA